MNGKSACRKCRLDCSPPAVPRAFVSQVMMVNVLAVPSRLALLLQKRYFAGAREQPLIISAHALAEPIHHMCLMHYMILFVLVCI